MSEDDKIGGETDSPGAIIPRGEPVDEGFVERTVANTEAMLRAEFDLKYRIMRYMELRDRYRTNRSEGASLKRQMQELNLPPQLLRTLKIE